LLTNLASLEEGEICYALDEDALYVKEGGVLVKAGGGGGTGTLTSVSATPGSGVSSSTVGGAVTIAGITATTAVRGVVQLADAAAITAGTAGRVVDAAQLKAVKDVSAGTGGNNTWTGSNTFNSNVTLGGTTAVTGTINFAGATIQNFPLGSLSDVNIGKSIALANGQMIAWDGTDWVNVPAPGGGGGGTITTVVATAGTGLSASETGGVVTIAGIDATNAAKGVMRFATSAEITGGTAGVAIDAAQLLAAKYTLPTASATVLGGVKVGTNLAIDGNGVLSASITGALIYKGDADVTATAPAAVSGDVYHNSTAGTADASWTGITGTVSKDALLIYNGTEWSTADLATASVTTIQPTLPVTVDATDAANPIVGVNAATTAATGVVRLADAAAVTAGTAGRVIDASQLKVVSDRLPVGTAADEMLKWDATNTKWVVTAVIDCGTY